MESENNARAFRFFPESAFPCGSLGRRCCTPFFSRLPGIQGMQLHTQASGQADSEERGPSVRGWCSVLGSSGFFDFLLLPPHQTGLTASGRAADIWLSTRWAGPGSGTPGTEVFPIRAQRFSFSLNVCSPLNADHGSRSLRSRDCPLIPVSRREEGRRGDTVPPSPGHTYM